MPADIICPKCGSEMVVRTAKKGPNAGRKFHVCIMYPECNEKLALAEQVDTIARKAHTRSKLYIMTYLSKEPLRQLVRISESRGLYLLCGQAILIGSFLYETLAILARARCDKLNILSQLFIREGTEDSFINDMQKQARERLEGFGAEPDSFLDFVMLTEFESVGLNLTDPNLKAFKKAPMEKWPLKEAESILYSIGLEGIGFGSCFPELTEKLYRNYHESIDMDVWSKWAARLAIPEKPTIISLEEQEEIVLQMVAGYASEYYPELLDLLDLREYLEE